MKKYQSIILLLAVLFAAFGTIGAQERGLYLPGLRGLNTAEQPGEGFTYANYFVWYPTDRFRDRDGGMPAINFDLDLVGDLNFLAYTTKTKFLGATYTASALLPILNSAVTIPGFGADLSSGAAFGDLYFEPLSLGWALRKGKVRAGSGFYAPTGAERVSADYWGHQFTLSGSYNPGKSGLWQINAASTWEAHNKKRNSDGKVGNNVTFEYGVGKTFIRNRGAQLFQFGIVGYSEFQLSYDTGTAVTPLNFQAKDRVHAIGPEFGVILPARKFYFMVRVLPEYAARSRTQGLTFVIGAGKTF